MLFIIDTSIARDRNYHNDLLNYHAILITDYLYKEKRTICDSIVAARHKQFKHRIYARNCDVRECSSKDCKEFLDVNHIQGNINATYRIGLFYKDELVQLITFGKNRFRKGEMELLRFCSKLNTQVIGGFSKLLKHQPYDTFISYIDRGLFNGEGYLKNNFTLLAVTVPSYSYYKDGKRLSRYQAQKHKLHRLLDNFDSNLSETQNMRNNGWIQVFDCGTMKVQYER